MDLLNTGKSEIEVIGAIWVVIGKSEVEMESAESNIGSAEAPVMVWGTWLESMIGLGGRVGWEGTKPDSIMWGILGDETKEVSILLVLSKTQWGNIKESRYELEGWSDATYGKMCS